MPATETTKAGSSAFRSWSTAWYPPCSVTVQGAESRVGSGVSRGWLTSKVAVHTLGPAPAVSRGASSASRSEAKHVRSTVKMAAASSALHPVHSTVTSAACSTCVSWCALSTVQPSCSSRTRIPSPSRLTPRHRVCDRKGRVCSALSLAQRYE
ncbi:hypothetical protein C3486_00685 [Streptomyces sp. Ru73]|nr:hypothetical protein C3486_00685 [Streptomyces sp. Ru73]